MIFSLLNTSVPASATSVALCFKTKNFGPLYTRYHWYQNPKNVWLNLQMDSLYFAFFSPKYLIHLNSSKGFAKQWWMEGPSTAKCSKQINTPNLFLWSIILNWNRTAVPRKVIHFESEICNPFPTRNLWRKKYLFLLHSSS